MRVLGTHERAYQCDFAPGCARDWRRPQYSGSWGQLKHVNERGHIGRFTHQFGHAPGGRQAQRRSLLKFAHGMTCGIPAHQSLNGGHTRVGDNDDLPALG